MQLKPQHLQLGAKRQPRSQSTTGPFGLITHRAPDGSPRPGMRVKDTSASALRQEGSARARAQCRQRAKVRELGLPLQHAGDSGKKRSTGTHVRKGREQSRFSGNAEGLS